jgi:hypothetical protein
MLLLIGIFNKLKIVKLPVKKIKLKYIIKGLILLG